MYTAELPKTNNLGGNLLLNAKRIAASGASYLALMTGLGAAGELSNQLITPNKTPTAEAKGSKKLWTEPTLPTECGYRLLEGNKWLGGYGVDVRSNGAYQTTGTSCKDNVNETFNIYADPPQYGFGWKCVELVGRLYATRGWAEGFFVGDAGAKALYTKAANGDWAEKGLNAHANGSNYKAVPGDMIVHSNGLWGHAAIFDHFDPNDGSKIWAVEQNNKDSNQNYTSWVTYSWDHATGTISKSGATISGFVHSDKNTLTNSGGSSGGNTAPGTVAYSSITEGQEFFTGDGWIYTKAGGRAWPIKNQGWTAVDTTKWGGQPTILVPKDQVLDNEVGYDRNGRAFAAHAPADGTTVFVDGSGIDGSNRGSKQYYFLDGKAYPITDGELDDLNARNKAQMIPNTGRLSDFTTLGHISLPDRSIYRYASTARVNLLSQHPNGTADAYYVNNDAVLDCLQITERQPIRILPYIAQFYLYDSAGRQVPELSAPATCAFPPQIVVKTPEDPKQFRVTGDNSNEGYVLHPYLTPLLTYLHTNGSPDLRVTQTIYGLSQGSAMTPPEGAFFRNMSNNEVFRSAGGIYQKVPSPDILVCHGNPSNIINVPGNAMEGMPQGPLLACAYTNRIIRGPEGQQYYITALNQREPIGNTAISACIKVRRGAGEPVPVAASTIGNNDPPDGKDAWCPYDLQPGLNFVKERSRNEVYKVSSDGSLQHAAALCPNPNNLYKLNWHEVPDNETASNVRGLTWYPSPEVCAALPG